MRQTELPPSLVLRHPLGRWVEPAQAWAGLLVDEPNSFWLDSGQDSGVSYLGASSRVISGPDVFDRLRNELPTPRIADDTGDGFSLGWVGWLGYELRETTLGTPVSRNSRYPVSALMFADRALAFDHDSREVTLLALGAVWIGEVAEWRSQVIAALEVERPLPVHTPADAPTTWAVTDDRYLELIGECQVAIHAGEAYQLCLTNEASVDVRPDPFAAYLSLRAASPAHHGGLIRVGDVALLSASPEQFLSVTPDGVVESKPIKGTRARGATAADDDAFRAELLASDKELAENLMIVDLMRNDIGRVSEIGSVAVPSLFAVESYAQVHQLVSTVRGQLSSDLSSVDAVVACFPAGSMTGAPKRNATLILDSLENRPRGIYAGAFGYFGLDGRVDLAMVIRSIVLDDGGATLGAGGGITALSVPLEELAEVKLKAAALLAVLTTRAP